MAALGLGDPGPRVLLDASALVDGRRDAGIGRYVASLIAALEDLPGIDLRRAQPRRPPFRESWAVRFLNAQPAVAWATLRRRPDLVHAPASDPVLLWPLRRQVVTLHDLIPWTTAAVGRRTITSAYLGFQRRRFRRCGAVIAVSQAVADEAVSVLNLDRTRVRVVPHGVDPVFTHAPKAADDALRAAAGVPRTGYVMWVGNLRAHDPRKAVDDLLEARRVLGSRPEPLVMVGAPGPESERVQLAAEAAGIPVVCPGFVTEDTLAALYRGAGVVAITSRHEGFGLPALEALACGAPLVATTGGNLAGLVGDNGLLVPPGEPAALARAIAEVLENPAVATRLRQAGPKVAAAYTWQRTAEMTAAIYAEVAGRPA